MSDSRQKRFLEIARQYKGVIYRVCSVYASDESPFSDLYQEVMINLWTGLESWRGEAKLSTWIYRLAINTCLTWHRRNRRRPLTISLDNAFDAMADEAEDSNSIKELYEMIGRLEPFDKAIVMMWLDEKSYDEIAQVMGISKTNVGTRLNRIRAKLSSMTES